MSVRNLAVLAGAAVAFPAVADLESDFAVGVTGAGQLAVEFNFASVEPIANFITGGGLNGDFTGWFSDEPGFANLDVDEPDEDFFTLGAGADISVMVISVEGPFRIYDPSFDSVVAPGGMFSLGTPDFDDHPFWTVDSTAPSFDANDFDYDVSFKLVDLGTTGYADSDTITVTFTRVPAPGTAGVLALAGLGLRRRR